MPKRRRKKEQEEASIIILVLFIIGIALLMSGNLWGILAIGLALLVTIAVFPEVGDVIKTLINGITELIEKRKVSTPSIPSNSKVEVVEKPRMVEEVIGRIREFRPYRRARKEKDIEAMLMQYLRGYYPSLRTQLQYERTQIDAQIGKVGIEIKYQPNESELDRLYGQIEKYLRHLNYVIAVIGYERSAESTDQFRKRLKRANWDKQVFVVSIP